MYKILICDDDHDIVSALKIFLTSEGYQTVEAYNGQEALEAVEAGGIDLVLMDVMMPKMDGIRATARMREEGNIPIILLTAKGEDSDKVLGLNIGADDYITKPFNPLEVIARVKSQLRRYTSLGGADKSPGLLTVGPISLDDSAKQVTVDGEPAVTKKAFEAFLALDLPEGQHEIHFSYFPKGLKGGMILTGASAAVLLLLYLIRRQTDKQDKKDTRRTNP